MPVRLRIEINAGEPIVEDVDLHGASVMIAKRLESEAETDRALVSPPPGLSRRHTMAVQIHDRASQDEAAEQVLLTLTS